MLLGFFVSGALASEAVVSDCVWGNFEGFGDFAVIFSLAQEFLKACFFSVEDGFFGAFAGAFRAAEGHAFFSLFFHHGAEAVCFHSAFDGDDFAEMIDEERHRAIWLQEAGGTDNYYAAAVLKQMRHDLEEHWEAASECSDISGDYGVAVLDWCEQGLNLLGRDTAVEIILDPVVFGYAVRFAPLLEVLALFLECGTAGIMLNIQMVHNHIVLFVQCGCNYVPAHFSHEAHATLARRVP